MVRSSEKRKTHFVLKSDDLLSLKRPDIVSERIKHFIIDKKLMPGDRIPSEKELMELFGYSRGTIRECLKSLEVQGLVKIKPGRYGGVRLCRVPYTRAMHFLSNFLHFQNLNVTQIYEVRKKVEPLIAESVVGRLSMKDFVSLGESIKTTRSYLHHPQEVDRITCRASELGFHQILAKACPNPLLSFFCRFIDDILLNSVIFQNYEKGLHKEFAESNLKFHEKLLIAFKKEQRDEVRELMVAHMNDAEKYVSKAEALFKQDLV
jgi:DNA-binding FadR family transcriptional regulator